MHLPYISTLFIAQDIHWFIQHGLNEMLLANQYMHFVCLVVYLAFVGRDFW